MFRSPLKMAARHWGLTSIFIDFDKRLKGLFPERQIYLRSNGRVQFYTISHGLQVVISSLGAAFLAWSAFSTVNVVFKDRIIMAKDYRFQRTQSVFEDKLAAMQLSYDELVAMAATRQQRADRRVAALNYGQVGLERASGIIDAPHLPNVTAYQFHDITSAGSKGHRASGFIDLMLSRLEWRRPNFLLPQHHPSLDAIERDTTLLQQLAEAATRMMVTNEARSHLAANARKQIIANTGIGVGEFLRRLGTDEGMGGPEIPLDTIRLDGISDQVFTLAYLKAEADLGELAGLSRAISRLPTAVPVTGKANLTSGFGPRLDPFTGRYGFHSGVDFAGAPGTPVLATANGQVIFAGRGGSYGNMVVLDHGFGLRTRYAHLQSIAVVIGQMVLKGASVGRLGSTGRSTGPHVHYEVLYDNLARNPSSFFCIASRTCR
jgi:murein DD-endopeptidase MepM/ murein hydrolase activator NlpD